MDEIGKILPSLFRKQIRRAEPRVLEILHPLWPRIAGKNMARHSQPTFFASGVLTLATDCATWSKQLALMSEEICSEINGFLGHRIVRKLRFKTTTQPDLFPPSRPVRVTPPPATFRVDHAVDASAISDPEIASALAVSYTKYFSRAGRS